MHDLSHRRRLLLIGFDSASPEIVEEGIAQGWLPHLRGLRERGTFGRLRSTSEWLVSSHWSSFYTGTPPNEHGCYHFVQWRPDEMALRRLDPKWMIREPFWRDLARDGLRAVAVDVPYTAAPKGGTTVELSGWGTSEVIFEPYNYPAELGELVRRTYARLPREVGQGLTYEKFTPRPLPELLRIKDQLVDISERASQLTCTLLEERPWDLFLTSFGSVHRAGHLLWSRSGVEGEAGPEVDGQLRDALREVYVACDRAIGRVVEAAGEGATILVFGLLGMAHNTSRTDLLPAMLARILADDPGAAADHEKLGWAKRLRKAIPVRWRHWIKAHLPLAAQDRLSTFWRAGQPDWTRTRAFSLTADVHGYVRVNLRGREAKGIVSPGADYERVCEQVTEGLLGFVDAETGEPVVSEIRRIDELFPPAPRRDALPDLVVRWAPTPCADTSGVVSPRFGRIPWPMPGKNPNGRSGNHTAEGFVLAMGEGIRPQSSLPAGAHILDLPPTIYALLGKRPPEHMRGRVLRELLPTSDSAARERA